MELCAEAQTCPDFPANNRIPSLGKDIALTNLEWPSVISSEIEQPEVLIDLPDTAQPESPVHNVTSPLLTDEDRDLKEDRKSLNSFYEEEPEMKTLLNKTSNHESSAGVHKPNSVHLLEIPDSCVNSVVSSFTDSDVEVEPECSTHLLGKENSSPKKVSKPPPSFQCSPTKPLIHHPTEAPRPLNHYPTRVSFIRWNWPAIRLGCLVTFLSSLIGMTCVVVGMLLAGSSTCDPSRGWWQGAVMYEIFPASFQDTDIDGFGDFDGVIQRLDYIRHLNVNIIRMNSIFSALDYPLEYEHVIDFTNVDPHLGRMDNFENLIKQMHARNMYLVLDMNPTVTSDQHTWAAHWLLHRPGMYENFYVNVTDNVWEEPPLESPDSYEQREWVVPHRTFGSQLFLNWSNPIVQQEILQILQFWLEKGVDGFYFKHLEHLHVVDEHEIPSIIQQWREVLDNVSSGSSRRVMMSSHAFLESLRTRSSRLVEMVVGQFDLLDVRLNVAINGTEEIESQLLETDSWNAFSRMPWISWHIGSVETARLASRLEERYTLGAIFLLMMLPGSVSLFYGDEIGLRDSFDTFSGKIFRGGHLSPMQWTAAFQGNFTNDEALPWLPPHPNYSALNVENRTDFISFVSHLSDLRNRSLPIAMIGELDDGQFSSTKKRPNYRVHRQGTGVVILERFYQRHHRFIVCVNFGEDNAELSSTPSLAEAAILFSSNGKKLGLVSLTNLSLDPGEAFIGRLNT